MARALARAASARRLISAALSNSPTIRRCSSRGGRGTDTFSRYDLRTRCWPAVPLKFALKPHRVKTFKLSNDRNPPMGTVLLLIWSAGHFSDLQVHSYERSYDGIWATCGGFDGAGAAAPVERRSEAGDCRGIGTPGILWGGGCAAARALDRSSVHMAPTGSWVAGALPVIGAWLHAGVGRAGG
jgi:hypothetical protein